MGITNYKIEEKLVGERLDKAASILDESLSRARVQRLIKNELISVNGEPITKPAYILSSGDVVSIHKNDPISMMLVPQDIPLDIVYEDSELLVVNKQKGLVVHPGNGNPDGTLVNAILNRYKHLSEVGGSFRPGIVHRIDKDTSGLLIVAKNDEVHMKISEQIKNHEVKKTYIALIRGVLKENSATIDMPIGRSTENRIKMAVKKNGKSAVTHIKVLERFKEYTLVEVNIETGRTHQIRVHLSEIGYPIVGDFVYSNGKNPFGVEGQMLHSMKLEFMHPVINRVMKLEAPIPEYFENVLEILRKENN